MRKKAIFKRIISIALVVVLAMGLGALAANQNDQQWGDLRSRGAASSDFHDLGIIIEDGTAGIYGGTWDGVRPRSWEITNAMYIASIYYEFGGLTIAYPVVHAMSPVTITVLRDKWEPWTISKDGMDIIEASLASGVIDTSQGIRIVEAGSTFTLGVGEYFFSDSADCCWVWLVVHDYNGVDTTTSPPQPPTPPTEPTPPPPTTDDISVILDGTALTFDVPPQIIDGRTLVPLRAIFEALGAEVNWDGNTQTITATDDDTEIILTIGSTTATVNGQATQIDVPAMIIDGRTLVPLRFVAESFGVDVDWDATTRTITITT